MTLGLLIVYALAVTVTLLWQVHGARGSGAAGADTPSANSRAQSPVTRVSVPERCPQARVGVAFYRGRYVDWRAVRDVVTDYPVGRKPRNCADAHYLAEVWPDRSFQERLVTEKWIEEHTLSDFPFSPGNHAWHRSVSEVQRVFPGTESWLLSCSAAEGGHGRWVGYAGVSYSDGLRDSNTVGGPMQFRFGTFTGMWRRAVEHARERGFRIPSELRDRSLAGKTRAWRSGLGQALAAGWARYTGNDNSHWSASWGNGC